MTDEKKSPYAPRVVSEGDIPVHKNHGAVAATCKVGIPRPMPCIVILVHGVNDIGEAYQNQEQGIIAGLSKRLNRTDLYAHGWKDFMMMPDEAPQLKITAPGRSPVIPFYWGYKPVTHDDWRVDQQRYREEVSKLNDQARLPYDAYQQDNAERKKAVGNDGKAPLQFQNDNFNNALDPTFAKGGGTFANATTNIPDMLGPGAGGAVLAAAGFASLHMNGGTFTHPIFPNPHRIYQFFAAQRLADLIIQIRQNEVTKNDVINIVAHSQGTIITMLANMLVNQAGREPVNCTILNHSPYSLEDRLMENVQDGHHQTSAARQTTFKNFCNLMATQYKGGEMADGDLQKLEASCTLRKPSDNPLRTDPRYRRDNNGRVYNYFCPNDGTVSLLNIQGFGWRGIPAAIANGLPNLYQRVFYQHGQVGTAPNGKPFELPAAGKGDFSYDFSTNASYRAHDVIVNGEELPEPFMFKLQGQDNHADKDPKTSDTPYTSLIDPDSPDAYISYSAKAYALSRTTTATYSVNRYQGLNWRPGHVLTKEERRLYDEPGRPVVRGVVSGSPEFMLVTLTRQKSEEDLRKEWQDTDPVSYSQHSSIVMSEFAPSHAMAFDLAIGQCKAFDFQAGKFWEDLLHRADWRDPQNKYQFAKQYYQTGRLSDQDTKQYMNRPDQVLPKGEYGVVNTYMNATSVKPSRDLAAGNQEITNLQWDMPKPKRDSELS
jgi:Protein of unknown function (DUF3274).